MIKILMANAEATVHLLTEIYAELKLSKFLEEYNTSHSKGRPTRCNIVINCKQISFYAIKIVRQCYHYLFFKSLSKRNF